MFRGHIHEMVFEQTDYNVSVEYSSGERMVVGVEVVSLDPGTPSPSYYSVFSVYVLG